ncbi:MAG: choice-of-anchor E domain-containing protein [Nitrosospira sp.]|nr:choice-of-anchor E domain-containing protein [Nitrosospira sp.]
MNFAYRNLNHKVALALGVLALTPLPASALLISTSSVGFTNSASVADAEGGGVSNNEGASFGTSTISQFDPNQGVLTGATINLTSTRTQSTWVQSSDGPDNGNNNQVTSSGTGSSTASISGPGLTHTFSSAINNTDSCTGARLEGCAGTSTVSAATPTNANSGVSSTSLDSYVGGGDVILALTAPTLTATQTSMQFTGVETTGYTVTWTGDVDATYEYLLHAAPSFDSSSSLLTLDLNFGTFYVGDTATLGFDLFNLANANRIGLDLDSISGTGDISTLLTSLSQFSGLSQGSGNSWAAMLDTSAAGVFSASYLFGMSDADVGAASSRFAYTLALNLTGRVDERLAPPAQVGEIPEPGILALLGLGLAGLSFTRKKSWRQKS